MRLMKCPKCGAPNSEYNASCWFCGTSLISEGYDNIPTRWRVSKSSLPITPEEHFDIDSYLKDIGKDVLILLCPSCKKESLMYDSSLRAFTCLNTWKVGLAEMACGQIFVLRKLKDHEKVKLLNMLEVSEGR
jgi:endogenous inhibitor of DNA gyrase (YacG/DUF329 family)